MKDRGWQDSFAPVCAPGARALILGTYPSPKSFENNFYYGHPQNRFWPLLAWLTGEPVPADIPEKIGLLHRHHLALWDVLRQCSIQGASDASIQKPVPNPVHTLVAEQNIQAVFCNGKTSFQLYQKHIQPLCGLEATALPSTSPANAAFTFAKLQEAWSPLLPYLRE